MVKKHLTNLTEVVSEKKRIERSTPIEFGFLLWLIMKVGFVLGCGVLIPAGIFWLITNHMEAIVYAEVLQNINRFQLVLLRVTVLSAAGQIVLAGALISAIALFASHKIAGPLIRFERQVRALGKGNINQTVNFRRGDQSSSFSLAFGKLCERLRRRIKKSEDVRDILLKIRENLEKSSTDTLAKENLAEILNQIDEQVLKLREAGSFELKTNERKV